ncbi:MAG: 3-isopropylmalate dehydratase small subunit [Peptococcaceae bacterium]
MNKNLAGKVFKFGDDVDTGQIIPGKYVVLTDPRELASHVFEDVAPEFKSKVEVGDIIVAGKNFGTGSSREHAPKAIKFSGISAVIAKSFARIFYRNAINIGLFAITLPEIDEFMESDQLTINLKEGKVINRTQGKEYNFQLPHKVMLDIFTAGGIIPFTKKELNLNKK